MKNILLNLVLIIGLSAGLMAQNAPIDFEAGGFGIDWTWAVFENDTNPPLEIIANPDPSGANTSASVAQFTALATGNPWAGTESSLATDLGVYTLSSENSIVKIMVWKSKISNVGIKMVTTSLGALPELLVPNTLTNAWEEITFDFTPYINNAIYAIEDVAQIVVFPDFEARDEASISYFDNITIGDGTTTVGIAESISEPLFSMSPNPATQNMTIQAESVISLVNIYGVSGNLVQVVPTNAIETRVDIDLVGLAKGLYVVEVVSEEGTSTRQLVKD
jgi:hypothetical protein